MKNASECQEVYTQVYTQVSFPALSYPLFVHMIAGCNTSFHDGVESSRTFMV